MQYIAYLKTDNFSTSQSIARFKNGFILSKETFCNEKNIVIFDFLFICYDFF